jgi:deoxyribodipyrimidine photo-lyase
MFEQQTLFAANAFPATLAAAHARLAAVRPIAYARTRNHLGGAVTQLSPYISHGLLSLREVLCAVAARQPLDVQHKFIYELGWRAYFQHVWSHKGDAIFASLHAGPLPDAAYSQELPADIRQASTGVPAIDQAVRMLYATGMLHNHARMWLASYVVHWRKVHWRVGADWLYGHLLDGDLASNHLSWQWVAGTGSSKPYLFNADNVARDAPADWHSKGSVLDASYDSLECMAHDAITRDPKPCHREPTAADKSSATDEPPLLDQPPSLAALDEPDADLLRGRDVFLLHPWNLGALPPDLAAGTLIVGVCVADFHHAWPWSDKRWSFVLSRMAELTPTICYGSAQDIAAALTQARSVRSAAQPHLMPWLAGWAQCHAAVDLFPSVEKPCESFSRWWSRVTRGLHSAQDLLHVGEILSWQRQLHL